MGRLSQAFEGFIVKGHSANGVIVGELRNKFRLRVNFVEEDAFYDYGIKSDLSRDITELLNSMLRTYHEERTAIILAVTGASATEMSKWDLDQRRIEESIANITAVGLSNDAHVEMSCVNMTDVEVAFRSEEILEQVPSYFLSELIAAWSDMRFDYNHQLRAAKHLRTQK